MHWITTEEKLKVIFVALYCEKKTDIGREEVNNQPIKVELVLSWVITIQAN